MRTARVSAERKPAAGHWHYFCAPMTPARVRACDAGLSRDIILAMYMADDLAIINGSDSGTRRRQRQLDAASTTSAPTRRRTHAVMPFANAGAHVARRATIPAAR